MKRSGATGDRFLSPASNTQHCRRRIYSGWCITLDRLIEVKRAAGRTKDFEAIAELEALREEGDSFR